jgi:hypothetical protein
MAVIEPPINFKNLSLRISGTARMVVPKLVKTGHNSPFGPVTSLLFPFRVHALTYGANAKTGLLTIFNQYRNTHAR